MNIVSVCLFVERESFLPDEVVGKNKRSHPSFPQKRKMRSIHWDNWKTLFTK